jgi:hypothetical protein
MSDQREAEKALEDEEEEEEVKGGLKTVKTADLDEIKTHFDDMNTEEREEQGKAFLKTRAAQKIVTGKIKEFDFILKLN